MKCTQRICCFFNYPSHYRESIYRLLDKELGCDFIFGDEEPSIKEMDCSVLNKVERVHYRKYLRKILYVRGVLAKLAKNYDTLILTPATNSITHWLILALFKLFPQKRIYYWTHGLYGNESRRQLFLKNLMFKHATGLFLYGNYAKELMIKQGYNPDKLHVVYNSLNYDNHLRLRNEIKSSNIYCQHFGNNNPTIIVIGRLNKRKRIEMLVEALRFLQGRISINVVIIGDGNEKSSLLHLISKYGLSDYFWFYGACYDEIKNAELIFNSDLCVVPGDIGLTAIHTMTFGVPVITHDYFPTQGPEFEIIKPGVTGNYYHYNDVASLSDCIYDWLKSKSHEREQVRKDCYSVIDAEWNPFYQLRVFKSILMQ